MWCCTQGIHIVKFNNIPCLHYTYVEIFACASYSVMYLTGELLCTEEEMGFLSALMCQILKKDFDPKMLVCVIL